MLKLIRFSASWKIYQILFLLSRPEKVRIWKKMEFMGNSRNLQGLCNIFLSAYKIHNFIRNVCVPSADSPSHGWFILKSGHKLSLKNSWNFNVDMVWEPCYIRVAFERALQ